MPSLVESSVVEFPHVPRAPELLAALALLLGSQYPGYAWQVVGRPPAGGRGIVRIPAPTGAGRLPRKAGLDELVEVVRDVLEGRPGAEYVAVSFVQEGRPDSTLIINPRPSPAPEPRPQGGPSLRPPS